jgi:hypothetical protein
MKYKTSEVYLTITLNYMHQFYPDTAKKKKSVKATWPSVLPDTLPTIPTGEMVTQRFF